jgi:hypothetical protein
MVVRDLLRFWFAFDEPVTRGAFVRHGLVLMTIKYGVDAVLVGLATGTRWTPLDYLQSVPLLVSSRLADAPGYLAPTLAVWTLPFLWIGVSMTLRRLLDAGWSAWWSLLFFVPVASYGLLAILAVLPGREPRSRDRHRAPAGKRLSSAGASIAFGVVVGLALLWVGVLWIDSYGLAVFMGTPFVLGVATAYFLRRRYPASVRETHEVVALTVVVLAGAAFLVGFEGAVCLLMVAPLGLVVAVMGGVVGRHLAMVGEGPTRGAVLIALVLPGAAAVEAGTEPGAALREVRSSVVVRASPADVWDEVVAFSPIPEPTSVLFRLGLAYPTHAEIDGVGVGAVRYCVFSTGAFVEPITAWEPGARLAFDVVDSPRPLRELSPWDVAPPHLDGYLLPRSGEFRMAEVGPGLTRLEGSTWYEQRLRPEGYWVLFSDYVIGRIHDRVLTHIKVEVEAKTASAGLVTGPAPLVARPAGRHGLPGA